MLEPDGAGFDFTFVSPSLVLILSTEPSAFFTLIFVFPLAELFISEPLVELLFMSALLEEEAELSVLMLEELLLDDEPLLMLEPLFMSLPEFVLPIAALLCVEVMLSDSTLQTSATEAPLSSRYCMLI